VRRALAAAAVGVACALAASGFALARGSNGSEGVRATVTTQRAEGKYRRVRLRIVREGRVALDAFLPGLESEGMRVTRVFVRDLDWDGEPEVVLDVYTGGAHCCIEVLVYRYLPARRAYVGSMHRLGNAGYRLVDLDRDGRPELRSADDRLAYVFTAYAASVFPVRVLRFQRGRIVDVTRRFSHLVSQDAARLWGAYLRLRRQRQADVRGLLAAWMAEMVLLGRDGEGWEALESAYRSGDLGPRPDLAGWPQGRAYLRALRTFLRQAGYAR